MDNQSISYIGTSGRTTYTFSPVHSWEIVGKKGNDNFIFEDTKEYKPTTLLLKSYVQAREDREKGLASPVFSSVKEMKKWFDEHE